MVDLVVAQVVGDRHALQTGAAVQNGKTLLIDADIQRHSRAGLTGLQREGFHHGVGQHGDFVARHVNRGQALSRDLIQGAVGCNRQGRCGDVNTQGHAARAQTLDRQRIVDFGGLRVVDRKRLHVGQGQVVLRAGNSHIAKPCAFGEVLEQEALPMEFVSVFNGP